MAPDLSGPKDWCKGTWKGKGGQPLTLSTGSECSHAEATQFKVWREKILNHSPW